MSRLPSTPSLLTSWGGAQHARSSACGDCESEALREHLAARLDQAPGTEGALLADLVFEATFGWQPSARTLESLSGGLLCESLVRALRKPQRQGLSEDYSFPGDRHPYQHQLEAWQALIASDPPRSPWSPVAPARARPSAS